MRIGSAFASALPLPVLAVSYRIIIWMTTRNQIQEEYTETYKLLLFFIISLLLKQRLNETQQKATEELLV